MYEFRWKHHDVSKDGPPPPYAVHRFDQHYQILQVRVAKYNVGIFGEYYDSFTEWKDIVAE